MGTALASAPLMSLFENNVTAPHSIQTLVILLGNSIILGFVLTALTLAVSLPILNKKILGVAEEKLNKKKFETILSGMNILFLCVGLTAIMILVNNNFARALAIGATLGLVRFRVNLNSKMIGSNMLFGIIAGIACGLNEVTLGWIVTFVYVILQGAFYLTLRQFNEKFLQDLVMQNGQDIHGENKVEAAENIENANYLRPIISNKKTLDSFENISTMKQ